MYTADQTQYTQLRDAIRRMGHVIEHAPGNIAGLLRRGVQPHGATSASAYPVWSHANQGTGDFSAWHEQPSPSWSSWSASGGDWSSGPYYQQWETPPPQNYGPSIPLMLAHTYPATVFDSGTDTDTASSVCEYERYPARIN